MCCECANTNTCPGAFKSSKQRRQSGELECLCHQVPPTKRLAKVLLFCYDYFPRWSRQTTGTVLRGCYLGLTLPVRARDVV